MSTLKMAGREFSVEKTEFVNCPYKLTGKRGAIYYMSPNFHRPEMFFVMVGKKTYWFRHLGNEQFVEMG